MASSPRTPVPTEALPSDRSTSLATRSTRWSVPERAPVPTWGIAPEGPFRAQLLLQAHTRFVERDTDPSRRSGRVLCSPSVARIDGQGSESEAGRLDPEAA